MKIDFSDVQHKFSDDEIDKLVIEWFGKKGESFPEYAQFNAVRFRKFARALIELSQSKKGE